MTRTMVGDRTTRKDSRGSGGAIGVTNPRYPLRDISEPSGHLPSGSVYFIGLFQNALYGDLSIWFGFFKIKSFNFSFIYF